MSNARLEAFQSHILDGASDLPPDIEIEFRRMFGGMGAWARGRIFATTWEGGLALKLSAKDQAGFRAEPGAENLSFTPGVVEHKYMTVPEQVLADSRKWRAWVERSVDYVLTLPLPDKRRRKK